MSKDRRDLNDRRKGFILDTDTCDHRTDYFSLQRTYPPTKSPVISPTSNSSSNNSAPPFFRVPKYQKHRNSSNLDFLLSPIVTSPPYLSVHSKSADEVQQESSPLTSYNNSLPCTNNSPHPSVLHELEHKALQLSEKCSRSVYSYFILPHDYLNISLDKDEIIPTSVSEDQAKISKFLTDYNLTGKIDDTEYNDIIGHFYSEHKETKKKFVIRYSCQLTVASISRLVNSYYTTSGYNHRKPLNGFAHLATTLDWDYVPKTLPNIVPGIFPCSNLEIHDSEKLMIAYYEIDDNVIPLNKINFCFPLDIKKVIVIFINLLKTLKSIHSYGIINNSLLPSDIFVNVNTYDVSIMGFDFAFSSTMEFQEVSYRAANKYHSLNYIPYTAPENFQSLLPVDFRADIYSIGALMYYLVSNKSLKQSNLFLLITTIVSLKPSPLHEINNLIPIEFSQIVSKMIAKDVNSRYTSIDFIIHDLAKLYQKLTSQSIPHDPVSVDLTRIPISLPLELIGREKIISSLISEISNMSVKTFTLTGPTGIGKTSILESLRIPAMIKKMFFTTWKCHDLSYIESKFQTFDLILSQLFRDILLMDKMDVIFWRDLLSVEVKADLSIVFDTIPELKKVLGPRYKHIRKSNLDRMVYQKELGHQYIIKKLFELFSRHAGWVLIIENIGELSETEAAVLEELWVHLKNDFSHGELNLTLLTSYGTINTQQTLFDVENVPTFLKENIIEIPRLSYENVERYLNLSFYLFDSQFFWKSIYSNQASYYYEILDKFKASKDRKDLTTFILKYTHGNPLIIKEIITQLRILQFQSEEPLSPLDVFKRYSSTMEKAYLSSNLFLGCLCYNASSNKTTIDILKYAACICVGNSFDIYELSTVSAADISVIYKVLYTGTIIQTLKTCSIVSKIPLQLLDNPNFPLNQLSPIEKQNLKKYTKFSFFHDSIQNALINLMKDSNELEEFHRNCGLRLYKKAENKDAIFTLSNCECFSIAYHFMNSWKVARSEEYEIYGDVLITAGWAAYSSYEHASALQYFQIAKELTTDESLLKGLEWVELHIYAIKGKHSKCLELVENLLTKYKNNTEDYAQFMHVKIQSLRALDKWNESYGAFLETLKVLNFPIDIGSMKMEEIIAYTNNVLKPKLPTSIFEIHALKDLPLVTDRRILLIQMLLMELNDFSLYLNKPYLLPFGNLMILNLFMEHGKSIYCSLSLIFVASLEASVDAKGLKRAHEYCKLAFNIVNYDLLEANELFIISFRWYCTLVGSIIEPIEKINQSFDLSILNSKAQMSESTFTKGIILKFKFNMFLTQGLTVKNIMGRMESVKSFYKPLNDSSCIYEKLYTIIIDILNVLTGTLSYDSYIENVSSFEVTNPQIRLTFSMSKCFACYVLKKYEIGAVIALKKFNINTFECPVSIEIVWMRYIFVLVTYKDLIRRCDENDLHDDETTKDIHERLKNCLDFFEELSNQNASVFTSMYLTVDTFIKILNKSLYSQIDILASFESAIESCSEYNNYLLEAILAEECAIWLKKICKDTKLPTKYFKLAYNGYKMWGLVVKVNQLDCDFGGELGMHLNLKHHSPYATKKRNHSKLYFQNDFIPFQQYSNNDLIDNFHSLSKTNSRKISDKVTEFSSYASTVGSKLEINSSDDVSYPSPKIPTDVSNEKNEDESINSSEDDNKILSEEVELIEENMKFNDLHIHESDWDSDVVMELSIKIAHSTNVEEIIRTLILFSINLVKANYACFILNSEDDIPFVNAVCLENDEVRFMSEEILSLRGDLLPVYLVKECMKNNVSYWRDSDKFYFDTTFRNRDPYFETNNCESVICIPIRSDDSTVVGALYLENQLKSSFIPSKKIDLLEYVCLQSYISIYRTEMVEKLETARKQAEEATADKTSFLANMSHEIRTPFNSLMSCAIFLLDTQLTESQRVYVETIKNSAMVTLNIIDGILSFSKIEHGSLMLEYEPFDITKCIEDAVQLVAEQVSLKNLDLIYIDDNYPIKRAYGDETRVIQVIINLLGNSTKFTNDGYILVRSTVNQISKDRYEFVISVRDTGIGIPEGSKGKLFKVFSQLDGSSKRVYGGSGLGLAISKKLAEYMGGDLDYESKEGNGTEFKFSFTSKAEVDEIPRIKNIGENDFVVILDARELSSRSLKKCIERRGFKDSNVVIFSKLNAESKQRMKDARFIFIYYDLIEDENTMKEVREKCLNSVIIYEIPFGMKIPIFVDDSGNNNNKKLIDYLLLNPFKREKLDEILRNGKVGNEKLMERKIVNVNEKENVCKLGEKCPLSILVAEDNILNTKVVRLQLKRLGYESEHAKDGIEVLEKSEERVNKVGKPFDLILMDLQMPRMDGFEASVEIIKKYGYQTRIIALSANVYMEEKNRCIQVGMIGFLNKPLLPEALATKLEETYLRKVAD